MWTEKGSLNFTELTVDQRINWETPLLPTSEENMEDLSFRNWKILHVSLHFGGFEIDTPYHGLMGTFSEMSYKEYYLL